jgi:hypothetical protein
VPHARRLWRTYRRGGHEAVDEALLHHLLQRGGLTPHVVTRGVLHLVLPVVLMVRRLEIEPGKIHVLLSPSEVNQRLSGSPVVCIVRLEPP